MISSELKTPEQFDALGAKVQKEEVESGVIIGTKAEDFISRIQSYADLGFDKIIIHNVNLKQEQFIDFFGNEVLPRFN